MSRRHLCGSVAAVVAATGVFFQTGGCAIDTQALANAVIQAAIEGAAAGLTEALSGGTTGTTAATGASGTTGYTP